MKEIKVTKEFLENIREILSDYINLCDSNENYSKGDLAFEKIVEINDYLGEKENF